jgi:hypothetical protein
MSSGPEVHPAQAEERDPPSTPASLTLLVGVAILVVIVFSLEVLHVQFLGTEAAVPIVDHSPGAELRRKQTSLIEAGLVPQDDGTTKRGLRLDAAMDEVVREYGKRS